MIKQTITTEIDIPDGHEFVRIERTGNSFVCYEPVPDFASCWIVYTRPIWQPPAWMRPGWIFCNEQKDKWYWSSGEVFESRFGWTVPDWICIYRDGKPTVGDFTPPPCDDWRQSKRRVGGGE